jgi:hypothetical protein
MINSLKKVNAIILPFFCRMQALSANLSCPYRAAVFIMIRLTQGGGEYALPWAKIPCPAGAAISVIALRFIPAFDFFAI